MTFSLPLARHIKAKYRQELYSIHRSGFQYAKEDQNVAGQEKFWTVRSKKGLVVNNVHKEESDNKNNQGCYVLQQNR
eukprot:767186-Hanusia_phi.AAC.1